LSPKVVVSLVVEVQSEVELLVAELLVEVPWEVES
jgi:hypothetical protein